jgi:hypothetical protein
VRAGRGGAVAAAVLLAGGIGLGFVASGSRTVAIPDDGPWTVGISTDPGPAWHCAQDEAVETSFMTASMPSTGGSFVLRADASRADVERVVACVTERITADRVGVTRKP